MIVVIELLISQSVSASGAETEMIAFYDKTKRTLLMYVEKHTRPPQVNSYRMIMISVEGCVANTERDY